MSSDPVVRKDDGVLVRLRVTPNAKRSELAGAHGDSALRLRVAAPPKGGRANAEVERIVAGLTGVPPSRVRIVKGHTGRAKTVFVGGVAAERVREALAPPPG